MSKLLSLLIISLLLTLGCGQSFKTTRVQHLPNKGAVVSGRSDVASHPELESGMRLYRQGDYDSAATFFQRQIFSDPGSWQAYYYLGQIHNQTGRFESAIDYFHQSLKRARADNGRRSLIYTGIGDSYRLSGKVGQARLNYHSALNLDPNCKEAKDGLALLNLRSGP